MIYTATYSSPLGAIVIECDGNVLTGLRFVESRADIREIVPMKAGETAGCVADATAGGIADEADDEDVPGVGKVKKWLDDYFAGRKPLNIPRLNPKGTDFQRRVWQALFTTDYGQTMSYGEIAKMVGCRSARAVGQAVGKNPIAIIIPCHRVVSANGALGGYVYGKERKKKLLEFELAKSNGCRHKIC